VDFRFMDGRAKPGQGEKRHKFSALECRDIDGG
jgi:hypothetical protein